MKKLLFITFAIILVCAGFALAQGDPELTKNKNLQIDGLSVTSITKYANGAGTTKITIPLAKSVSKFCLQPTAATGVRIGTAAGFSGDQKAIAANAEWCRSVRTGVTQLQYSSTTVGTAVIEKMY